MLTDQVVYQDDRVSADITVSAADGPATFRRARLQMKARAELFDADTYLLKLYGHPDIASTCAGTLTLDGQTVTLSREHPLTFSQYLTLPEPLLIQLEDACYRLNPAWLLKPVEQEQADQKKVVTSSGGD